MDEQVNSVVLNDQDISTEQQIDEASSESIENIEAADNYISQSGSRRSSLKALQVRYARQVHEKRESQVYLQEKMANIVAWTWLPGRDRTTCPGIVDVADARLLTMDRFPSEPGAVSDRIALTMYRPIIERPLFVRYCGPNNIELFKDFSIHPQPNAFGLHLDANNEEVFRQALALDLAIELAAKEKLEMTTGFTPPDILVGFPAHYIPAPDWKAPMQQEILYVFDPKAPTLKCFLSTGGIITSIIPNSNGFRVIQLEQQDGRSTRYKMPIWTTWDKAIVYEGAFVPENVPLADLPREVFNTRAELMAKYNTPRILDWLESRIMEGLSDLIEVEEWFFDKEKNTRSLIKNTWRVLPLKYATSQLDRARRFFLDLRLQLGRVVYTIDTQEGERWYADMLQSQIHVMSTQDQPTAVELTFGDDKWGADLMTHPEHAAWGHKIPYRFAA